MDERERELLALLEEPPPDTNVGADNPMLALADRLKALRADKDALAEQTKANNAEIERTERELSDLMAQGKSRTLEGPGRCST